jgi:hypothetical protein
MSLLSEERFLDVAVADVTTLYLIQGKCLCWIGEATVTIADGLATVDVDGEVGHRPSGVEDQASHVLVSEGDWVNHEANVTVLLESEPLEVTDTDALVSGRNE